MKITYTFGMENTSLAGQNLPPKIKVKQYTFANWQWCKCDEGNTMFIHIFRYANPHHRTSFFLKRISHRYCSNKSEFFPFVIRPGYLFDYRQCQKTVRHIPENSGSHTLKIAMDIVIEF